MTNICDKTIKFNIGLDKCCTKEKKKKKDRCKAFKCFLLPVCGSEPGEFLPEGGDPGDHLVRDEDNNPIWKPVNECVCEPVEGLPEGGSPNDVLSRDEDNNPVWKPASECDCEPMEGLPEGGSPNDVLTRDEDNNPVWKPANECDCEPMEGLPEGGSPNDVLSKDEDNKPVWKPVRECDCLAPMPVQTEVFESSSSFTAPKDGYYRVSCVGGGGGGSGGYGNTSFGCGGGSGGSGNVVIKSVYLTKDMQVSVRVGSGGSGGSAVYSDSVGSQAGNGENGGTTSFGASGEEWYVEAHGGTGGIGGGRNQTFNHTSSSGTGLCKGIGAMYGTAEGTSYLGGYPLFGYFADNKPLGYGLGGTGGGGYVAKSDYVTDGMTGDSGCVLVEW